MIGSGLAMWLIVLFVALGMRWKDRRKPSGGRD